MASYIYRFINKDKCIIYVGKTNDINRRYNEHFGGKGHLPSYCYSSVWKVEYIKTNTELNALLLETYYINLYRPQYNKLNKTIKPTDMENTLLNDIPNNWKTYRIVNINNEPKTEYELNRKLTWVERLFFIALFLVGVFILIIFEYFH